MKNYDKLLFGLLIGIAFPFILGLLFTILWFYVDKNESNVLFYLCSGLLAGIIIDLKYLKYWINRRYDLPVWFMILIYLIYNLGMYGFFMGFPVFNVLLGFIGGYYYGKRVCFKKIKSEMHSKIIERVSLFTGLIMTLICITSGFIALTDKTIGENVQGMLGLGFEISHTMILAITIIGGVGLIAAQYFITKLTMQKTIRLNNRSILI